MGRRLARNATADDLVARLGGDEFAALYVGLPSAKAADQRARDALAASLACRGAITVNTRLAAGTLEHIVADAACVLAIVDPASHREAVALAARLPLRHRLLLDERAEGFLAFEDEMAKPGPPVEPPPIADDAQAFQPYTSGSTGRPKGAIMTHHGMLWYVAYNAAALSQERVARHGEADASCRRLLRADAGL